MSYITKRFFFTQMEQKDLFLRIWEYRSVTMQYLLFYFRPCVSGIKANIKDQQIYNLHMWHILNSTSLNHYKAGFPANETFSEKMQTFSILFRKLFRKISHFFCENECSEKCKMKVFKLYFVFFDECSQTFYISEFFRGIYAFFLSKFSYSFFREIFALHFSRNRLKRNFAKKAKILAFSIANEMRKMRQIIFSRNFASICSMIPNDFPFSL